MKINYVTIFLQALSLALVLFVAGILFGETSCNGSRGKDSKAIAQELNLAKFKKLKDQKNADFLVTTAEIQLKEICLAQLAQQEAKQVDVKELGKMLERNNARTLNTLMDLANKKAISVPTSPTIKGEQAFEFLTKKSGYAFDKEYCDMMVTSQKRTIAMLETITEDSSDMDIRIWALNALPELRKHLNYALVCQRKCVSML